MQQKLFTKPNPTLFKFLKNDTSSKLIQTLFLVYTLIGIFCFSQLSRKSVPFLNPPQKNAIP